MGTEATSSDLARTAEERRLTGDYLGAIRRFDAALAQPDISPERRAWCLAHRGAARGSIGQTTQAIADLGAALEMSPGYAWAWGQKGEAHRLKARDFYLKPGSWSELRREIEQGLAAFDQALALGENPWARAHRAAAALLIHWYANFICAKDEVGADERDRIAGSASQLQAEFTAVRREVPRYAWATMFHALLEVVVAGERAVEALSKSASRESDEARAIYVVVTNGYSRARSLAESAIQDGASAEVGQRSIALLASYQLAWVHHHLGCFTSVEGAPEPTVELFARLREEAAAQAFALLASNSEDIVANMVIAAALRSDWRTAAPLDATEAAVHDAASLRSLALLSAHRARLDQFLDELQPGRDPATLHSDFENPVLRKLLLKVS